MAFIEKQSKGGKTYHYLTETVREGSKFRKIRINLGSNPTKSSIAATKKELKSKIAAQNDNQFQTLPFNEQRIKSKYFIWERPCKLHLPYIAAIATQTPQVNAFGHGWGITYGFFQNNMVKFVWDAKILTKSGIYIINNFMDDNYFSQKDNQWHELVSQLKKQFEKSRNLRKLSDKQLAMRYNQFLKAFLDWWGASQVSDCISFGAEYLLKEIISENQICIITTPTRKSYTTLEEESMLNMLVHIKKKKKLRNLFEKTPKLIQEKLENYRDFQKLLKKHQEAYYWSQNNYADFFYLDNLSFITKLKQMLMEIADPPAQLEIIYQQQKQLKNKRDELIDSLNFSAKYRKLLNLVDYFTIFQDDRKALSLEANHYTNEFLLELSRRTGISMNLLYLSIPYEYETILHGKFPTDELSKRQKGCLVIFSEKGEETIIGAKYQQIYRKILGTEEYGDITEFEGRRAEGGKVSGRARVVLDPRNVKDFKYGEILVTTMTSPEFTPLMKKAAAIITDEGGLTCHAAVVARELNKPCIVGTSIATQALKDGDLVEVNANHGLVRILERKH